MVSMQMMSLNLKVDKTNQWKDKMKKSNKIELHKITMKLHWFEVHFDSHLVKIQCPLKQLQCFLQYISILFRFVMKNTYVEIGFIYAVLVTNLFLPNKAL